MEQRTPEQVAFDQHPLDIDAWARALGFCPIMSRIQAYFLGGRAGESFLHSPAIAGSHPRPTYFAMNEDGLTLQVVNGQLGLDVWTDDEAHPTHTRWCPLPRTFEEAFTGLLQLRDGWDEADRPELWDNYRFWRSAERSTA